MKARLLHSAATGAADSRATGTQRTFAVVFDPGDEVVAGLQRLADDEQLSAASFPAIGACARVVLGYFDLARRDYNRITLDEQVEVLTLTGNVALSGGERKIHAHVVVGRADGTAHGGHLLEARVQPTLEVVLVESPAHLVRLIDQATGLALLDLDR
jgi:uncharacterized protein